MDFSRNYPFSYQSTMNNICCFFDSLFVFSLSGDEINENSVKNLVNNFEVYVDVERLVYDIWLSNASELIIIFFFSMLLILLLL
jgi:hypothetical protein